MLGLKCGVDFKVDTILCKDVKDFILNVNKNNKNYFAKLTNGSVVTKNNTRILYDALLSDTNEFILDDNIKKKFPIMDGDDWKSIKQYMDSKLNKSNEDSVYKNFKQVFENKIINSINDISKLEPDKDKDYDNKKKTIENLRFYSNIDAKFNYLSNYESYKNECVKVIKLYYSAYLSILKKMLGSSFNDLLKSTDIRGDLYRYLNNYYKDNEPSTGYYSIIKKFNNNIKTVVTTNYTSICDRILGKKCIHIHGSMLEFEKLKTKEIKNINEFNDYDDIIFPYILIQSGIKPIIHPKQIKFLYDAYKSLSSSKYVIVLGYTFSCDDEHIINMFREILKKNNVRLVYLKYVEKDDNKESEKIKEVENGKLKKMFNCDDNKIIIEILRNIDDFEEILEIYKNK